MRKVIVMLCAAITFAACGKKEATEPQGEGGSIDYINAPLFPANKTYWNAERPSNGGTMPEYVLDNIKSLRTDEYIIDHFAHRSDNKSWRFCYNVKSDGKYRLDWFGHYINSEPDADFKEFIAPINKIFDVDIPNRSNAVRITTSNSLIEIGAPTVGARIEVRITYKPLS